MQKTLVVAFLVGIGLASVQLSARTTDELAQKVEDTRNSVQPAVSDQKKQEQQDFSSITGYPTVESLYKAGKLGKEWSRRELDEPGSSRLKPSKYFVYDNPYFRLHIEGQDKILFADQEAIVFFSPEDSFLRYQVRGHEYYSAAVRFQDRLTVDDGGVIAGHDVFGRAGGTPRSLAVVMNKKDMPFAKFIISRLKLPPAAAGSSIETAIEEKERKREERRRELKYQQMQKREENMR